MKNLDSAQPQDSAALHNNHIAELEATIEDQKRQIAYLRHHETIYRNALQSCPAGFLLLFDTDLRYTLAAGTHLAAVGLTEAAVQGRSITDVWPPDISTQLAEPCADALTGTATTLENIMYRNGFYTLYITPVRDENGTVVAGMMLAHEQTRCHEAELSAQTKERALMAVGSGILIADAQQPDMPIIYCNQAFERITGYSAAETLGKNCRFLQGPGTDAAQVAELRQAISIGVGCQVVLLNYHQNGTPFWNELSISPVYDDEEQLTHYIGVVSDISKRLEAERALRLSEQKFRHFVKQTPDGVVLANEQGLVVEWNYAQEQITGLTANQVLGMPIWDVQFRLGPDEAKTPEVYEQMRERTQELFQTGQAPWLYRLLENDIQRPDGTRRVIQTLTFAFQTDTGFMAGTVTRDVTARKSMEQELRESHRHIGNILESITDAFFALDQHYRFTYVNHQAAHLLRREPRELLGKIVWDEFPEALNSVFHEQYRLAMESHVALDFEAYYPPIDTWLHVHVYPSYEGLSVYFQDINERKQAEKEIQHANESLSRWVHTLERRTYEMTMLSEMGDLLQACRSRQEAYQVIAQVMPHLLPDDAGALYMLSESRTLLEIVASWGNLPMQRVIASDDCWALRRGRVHLAHNTRTGLICGHLPRDLPDSSFCAPMMAQGESSGIFHVCRKHGSYNDAEQQLALMVTEHISLALANLKLQETLRHQAIRDPLTGLYNRRHMEESLEREIRRATRRNASFGVVMLDLDHFKRLNDTYGHAAGDAILRRMGEFLKDHVRGEDIACRYGGEEFALIILDASLEDVHRIADTIRQDVKQLDATYQNHHIGPLTVSLGVAAFPQHGTTIESLLQSADMALYRAKGEGRDRVVVIGQVSC